MVVIAEELPTGVVTFLFSDVVGSVAMWERDPTTMLTAQQTHEDIIAEAVRRHGGHLLLHKGEGDSTFSVFARPADAVAAATAAQRALRTHDWPETTPITVRMSVHTGEAVKQGDDYFGKTPNRAARIRALAQPGEILISGSTVSLLDGPPDGVRLRFRRAELLRGVNEPIEIHEVVLDDGGGEPPVVVEADGVPLPARLTRPPGVEHVGRSSLRATAAELAAAAAAGAPQVLLLCGEPGMGKTDLCTGVVRSLHDDGWNVVFGTCEEDLARPYGLFVDALRAYVTSGPRAVLVDHVVRHGGELERIIPEFAARVGSVPVTEAVDPETNRLLLVDAITDLVLTAARERPLALFVDDLHWADQDSLTVLRHLARVAGDAALLVLGTYRTVETGDSPAWEQALPALIREPAVQVAEMSGLDEDDLLVLLSRLAGHDVTGAGPELARYLARATGGNPFYAVEVLRHFAETGVIARDADGRWRVVVDLGEVAAPANVRAVILDRVRRLGQEAHRVLGVAATVGDEFDVDVVAAVLDQPNEEVLDALEAAVAAALLLDLDNDRFRFAHALVGQTLHDQLSASRRSRRHRRVAQVLAELHPGQPADIAGHLLAAGSPDDLSAAVDWVQRAGEQAAASLAPADAARWFRRGLDELGEHVDDGRRADLLIGLGEALRASDVAAARSCLLEAATLARDRGDLDRLVRAAIANDRGDTAAAGVVDQEQVEVLEAAIDAVGPDDGPERAILLALLAIDTVYEADPGRRLRAAGEAEAIARRIEDPVILARVLALTTEATRLPDSHSTRDRSTAELHELAQRIGDPVLLGMAAMRRARLLAEAGRIDEAESCLDDVRAAGSLLSLLRWESELAASWIAQIRGDLAAADAHALTAMEVATADNQPDAMAVYAAQVFPIRWDAGTLGEIEPLIADVVAQNPGIPGFRVVLAVIYCELDRFDEARALVDGLADDDFADFLWNTQWMVNMTLLAEVAYQVGDEPLAEALYERLLPWADQHSFSGICYLGPVRRYLGQLAVVLGRHDDALVHLDAAAAAADAMAAPVERARADSARAAVLAARGGPADLATARDLLARVAAAATAVGASTIARRAAAKAEALAA